MAISEAEKIVLAVKLDTMSHVVDSMLTMNGHEPLISKLTPEQLGEFWSVLSSTNELKHWVLPLQPVLGTRNLTKLQWLNQPLKIAKIIANSTPATEVPDAQRSTDQNQNNV
jgi:hypothetical protein